jgi:hypothetical protein
MKKAYILLLTIVFLVSNSSLIAQKRSKQPLIGTFFRYYEPTMQAWQGLDSFAFTYDKQGNKASITEFMGDDSLYATSKRTFTYNQKNQLISEVDFYWDDVNSNWSNTPTGRSTYSYNNGDSLIAILYEYQDSTGWKNTAKWENTYDGNNNKTQELGFMWDTLTKNWSNSGCQKSTFTYQNNQRISKTSFTWNVNLFKATSKWDYTYGSNGKLETVINQIWDGVNSWHNSAKDSLLYNNNGQITEQYGFNFDEIKAKNWVLTYKYLHTFNLTNLINQTNLTFWDTKSKNFLIDVNSREITYNYNKNNDLNTIFDKRYDTISKKFVDYNETYFYYQPDTTNSLSIYSNEINDFTIYPNPFNDKIILKSTNGIQNQSNLFLTNNIGEIIKIEMEKQENEITIFTSNLSKGIYYLHLETNDASHLTKIVKM